MLDKEATDDIGEEIYYLDCETTIERKGFDEELQALLKELGYDIRA